MQIVQGFLCNFQEKNKVSPNKMKYPFKLGARVLEIISAKVFFKHLWCKKLVFPWRNKLLQSELAFLQTNKPKQKIRPGKGPNITFYLPSLPTHHNDTAKNNSQHKALEPPVVFCDWLQVLQKSWFCFKVTFGGRNCRNMGRRLKLETTH